MAKKSKRRVVLGTVASILVIGLPQWLSAVWSLFSGEPLAKVFSRSIRTLSFSPFWITVPLGLALFVLVLYEFRRAKHFAFTYAYGLDLKNLSIGRDEANPAGGVLQLGLLLANAADGPLKYHVEEMEVIIGDRTIPNPNFRSRGGVIPRGSEREFFYPPFGRDVIQPRTNGVLRYSIIYGHPEIGFSRWAKKQLSLTMRLDDRTGVRFLIDSESDEEIKDGE
jgi:hypothetical protein